MTLKDVNNVLSVNADNKIIHPGGFQFSFSNHVHKNIWMGGGLGKSLSLDMWAWVLQSLDGYWSAGSMVSALWDSPSILRFLTVTGGGSSVWRSPLGGCTVAETWCLLLIV